VKVVPEPDDGLPLAARHVREVSEPSITAEQVTASFTPGDAGVQDTDRITGVIADALTVTVCDRVLHWFSLHASSVIRSVPAARRVVVNSRADPVDGLPPVAVHEYEVTAPLIVGEQVIAPPAVTVDEQPSESMSGAPESTCSTNRSA